MDDPNNSKRRRGIGAVTPNACTECRRKRAKCDGKSPCFRCVSQKVVDCVYEIPMRQSKENMRSEIEQLRIAYQRSNRILAALVSKDTAGEVLNQLQSGETFEAINTRLDDPNSSISLSKATTFASFHEQQAITVALRHVKSITGPPLSSLDLNDTQRPSSQPNSACQGNASPRTASGWSPVNGETPGGNVEPDMMTWEPELVTAVRLERPFPLVGSLDHHLTSNEFPAIDSRVARSKGQGSILGQSFGLEELPDLSSKSENETWTRITSDGSIVEHLMALYFCWEYPTFASLSKEQFLDDFKSGSSRNCSSLLVNALLAVGCRFSNKDFTRADPSDSNTSGDHYFAEALRLLDEEDDRHTLTTIQALGLMSIREASCGRSSQGLYFSGQSIRLAIEMNLHQDISTGQSKEEEADYEVRSATFWGAFALDQAWSISIGRLPHFSRDIKLVDKPGVVDHVEASEWVPYTDDGAPLKRSCIQPSNVRSVYTTFCELSEIVHRSLYTLYTPGINVTSKSIISVYTEYLRWYDAIPTVLRLGQNFTPAVLFAHMYYHFAVLLLFRPFIKLEFIDSGISPRDVCSQTAEAISALAKSYAQLYTLQRTPSFVPYFILTSSITHLVTLDNTHSNPEHVQQGLADLKEMTRCHGFAIRGLDILHFLIRHWKVEGAPQEEVEELKDFSTVCRPRNGSMNQFCPNVTSEDIVCGIGPVGKDDNPLFGPFPLQGRPLLDVRTEMERAGFRILST